MPHPPGAVGLYLLNKANQQRVRLGDGSENSMDLMGYVEFQNSYKALVRIHKRTLRASRTFWSVFLHHEVSRERSGPPLLRERLACLQHRLLAELRCLIWVRWRLQVKLERAAKYLKAIELLTSRTDFSYKAMLERYGNSSKLLRLYARFLEECK